MAKLSPATDEALEELGRYTRTLLDGCSLQIKQLSVTQLNVNFTKYNQKEYQVFCDDYRIQFCEHYDDPFMAVDKFIELKKALYK